MIFSRGIPLSWAAILVFILMTAFFRASTFILDFESLNTGYTTGTVFLAEHNIWFGDPTIDISSLNLAHLVSGVFVTDAASAARSGSKFGRNCRLELDCEDHNQSVTMAFEFEHVQDQVSFYLLNEQLEEGIFRIVSYSHSNQIQIQDTLAYPNEWIEIRLFGTKGVIIEPLDPATGGPFLFRIDDIEYEDGITEFNDNDFFLGVDRSPINVDIYLDSIGVVINPLTELDGLNNSLSTLGLQFTRTLPENIVIYGLPEPIARDSIVNLSRSIQNNNSDFVQIAGMLVLPENNSNPIILTDEIVVQYNEGVSEALIDSINADLGTTITQQSDYLDNLVLLEITPESPGDVITVSRLLEALPTVAYAHPNFIMSAIPSASVSSNPILNSGQWHLTNPGNQPDLIDDADVDADEAFTITTGDHSIKIAIIDTGVDLPHLDLDSNLVPVSSELTPNSIDDDGNGEVDDPLGWNFLVPSIPPIPTAAIGIPIEKGTWVAGGAAAEEHDVKGVCPSCSIWPVRRASGVNPWDESDAVNYASSSNSRVINLSWNYPAVAPSSALGPTMSSLGNPFQPNMGRIIVMTMGDEFKDVCLNSSDRNLSAFPNIIPVSQSSGVDSFSSTGFGDCMSILAPGESILTTDITGMGSKDELGMPMASGNYEHVTGTGMSTSLVSGAAGLILSAKSDLNSLQVKRLLQDTADKIDPFIAEYDVFSGYSSPSTSTSTHGYGRLNAYEAVKIVAPAASGGQDGVDIYLRDNQFDWGNTERPSNEVQGPVPGPLPHWTSQDIKVDSPVGGYQTPPMTSVAFDMLTHENPEIGGLNRVYVRVRNRGPEIASDIKVKVLWAQFSAGLPLLASDFWSSFPNDPTMSSGWNPLQNHEVISVVGYSGSSVAGSISDQGQIVSFDWVGPSIGSGPNHFCLLAFAESTNDPIEDYLKLRFQPDNIVQYSNNITLRNVQVVGTSNISTFSNSFYILNPFSETATTQLSLQNPDDQLGIAFTPDIYNKPILLEPGERQLVTVDFDFERENRELIVDIYQTFDRPSVPNNELGYDIFGGFPLYLVPYSKMSSQGVTSKFPVSP